MIRCHHFVAAAVVSAALVPQAVAQGAPDAGPRGRGARIDRLDDARIGPEVTERVTRTVRLGRDGMFDISNLAGTIVITGGGGNEVTIDATKRTRARDNDAGLARLRQIDIQILESNNRVEVRTEYPRQQRIAGAVDYTITLPQDASVLARSVSGDIRLRNVRGDLRAESVSGNVETGGARNLSRVRTVSGDILITDAEAPDLATIRTVSGNQTIRNLKAHSVDVNSVSGDVRFENTSIERGDIKTVSGNIEFSGQLARSGRYQVSSHSGDIRLAIADIGFEVEANTFSGNFRSDYPVASRDRDPDVAPGGRRLRPNRTVRGTYGNGSAILDLRSFSGNIVVSRR